MSVKVRWLDDFPDHWQRFPSKRLFPESKERAGVDDEQLSATQDYGVIPQKEFMRLAGRSVVLIHKHLDKRKRVELDDFVISMRSFQGGLERAWSAGAIRSSYVVIKPTAGVDVGYFSRLFKSSDYIQALQATAHFIRDGQDLNYQNFCLVDLALPPIDEQKQIASFLDYETAKIDALIEKQQQLIALLGEKRQAVISHAVTKGLNPDAPMRDSGVEWLGEVPSHWNLLRLKHAIADDGIQMGPFGTSLINVLREPAAYCVFGQSNTISGDFHDVSRWLPESAYRGLAHYRLLPGDLVLTRKGSLGNCRVVPDDVPRGIMDSDTIRVRTRSSELSPVLLAKLMHDAHYIDVQIDLNRRGAILPGLNTTVVGNLLLAVPPLKEQEAILADLSEKCGRLDQIADCLFDKLSLLQERRTALISAAVTGKIDVRGWKRPSAAPKKETEMEVA